MDALEAIKTKAESATKAAGFVLGVAAAGQALAEVAKASETIRTFAGESPGKEAAVDLGAGLVAGGVITAVAAGKDRQKLLAYGTFAVVGAVVGAFMPMLNDYAREYGAKARDALLPDGEGSTAYFPAPRPVRQLAAGSDYDLTRPTASPLSADAY